MTKEIHLIPKRRFKEFQNTHAWEQRKLGEISDSFSGGTPSANNRDYYNGSIPFIRSGEINSNATELFITEKALNNSSAKLVTEGDILYALYGATSGVVGISQINGAINQAVLAIKPKFGHDTYLITQWLKKQKQTITSTYLQGGQGNLSGSIVKNLMIDLPTNKEEQLKIGSFFKQFDETIALNQRKLEKTKALKSAYLSEMFPAEGEREPKRRFPGFTQAWEQRSLGDYTKLITKGTTPKDKSGSGEINFVKVENIANGKITPVSKITEEEHDNYLKRSKLEDKDILFSIAGTLGRTAVVDESILPANTNQALAIIRGYDFNTDFLITSLNGRVVAKYICKNPTVGAQPNLSLEQIGSLVIDTPSRDEQVKIGQFFADIDHLITLYQLKLKKLQNIKYAYLNEMFI